MSPFLPLLLACSPPGSAPGESAGAVGADLSWELPLDQALLRAGEPVVLRLWAAGAGELVLSSDLDGELLRAPAGALEVDLVGLSRGRHQLEVALWEAGRVVLGERRQVELNGAPQAPQILLSPAVPTAETGLELQVLAAADPEGDPLALVVSWTLDGAASEPPESVRRDQRWAVQVQAADALGPGPPARAEVTVGNALPRIEAVQIDPEQLLAGDTASCRWSFSDADGDPDLSTVSWTVNGRVQGEADTLSGFVGGDLLRCTVTPADGLGSGEPAWAEVEVANSPPVLESVSLGPSPVTEGTTLVCDPGPTTDPDGATSFTYAVTWFVDGEALGWVSRTLDGDRFDEGQVVQCQLVPSDGLDEGAPVLSDALTVSNSLPGAPAVAFSPERPVEGIDELSCALSSEAVDLDGDPLETTLSLAVDGEPWTGSLPVPVESLEAGQVWTCTGVSSDEEGPGPAASTSVTVRPDQPLQVTPGTNMSCLLGPRGSLDCWGWDVRQLASTAPEGDGFASVALGSWNGCALDEAGAITCWGGEEDCITDVPTTDGWVQVDVGYDVCCALDGAGALSCWGDSTGGLVDDAPASGSFRDLSVGSASVCVLDSVGAIQCWGSDSDGLVSDAPAGEGWLQVAVGNALACALDGDGFVSCWGEDYEGAVSDTPMTWGHTALSVGDRFACALDAEGGVGCWGRNDSDQVDGAPASTGWSHLESWSHHSCVMAEDGDWECWSRNDFGQCVQPPQDSFSDLAAGFATACGVSSGGGVRCWGSVGGDVYDELPGDGGLVSVAVGLYHGCALDTDGELHCFGWDEDGQVGDAPDGSGFVQAGLGYRHGCAIDEDGVVRCWGADEGGQVSGVPEGSGFTTVQAGFAHACALDADGVPWCWGVGDEGAFESPEVEGLVQLASTWGHACGLDGDGLATCWGSDDAGQVSEVPTDEPFTAVVTPAGTTCALDPDGLLQCWGDDDVDYLSAAPAVELVQLVGGYNLLCGRSRAGGWGCWGTVYVDRW